MEQKQKPPPPERFMVHMPTMVVQCNDSNCPVGSTIVGWPHLMTDGCMYAATTRAPLATNASKCVKCRHTAGVRADGTCAWGTADRVACCGCECEFPTAAREAAAQEILAIVLGFNQLDDLAELPKDHPNRKHVEREIADVIDRCSPQPNAVEAMRRACVDKVEQMVKTYKQIRLSIPQNNYDQRSEVAAQVAALTAVVAALQSLTEEQK